MSTLPTPAELAAQAQAGERLAAARLITALESSAPATANLAFDAVQGLPRPRHVIGVTGPPGAGKSTLIDYLIAELRAANRSVAVLAVDPSSPFTGGALLGDRIRMASHRTDEKVFIRSMGSRGASGGLAAAAGGALRVLGAAGFSTVLVETTGAGQTETEIARAADTVCVLQVPGLGDDLQLMKRGMLEIADVFIVHKSDRPGAEDLKVQLEEALHETPGETCRQLRELGPPFCAKYTGPRWDPPVLAVSSVKRSGGPELLSALGAHRTFLDHPEIHAALARTRLTKELLERACLRRRLEFERALAPGGACAGLAEDLAAGKISFAEALKKLDPM